MRHALADELWDRFVAHGVTAAEIATLDHATLERQVHELRQAEPDELSFDDYAIAASLGYIAADRAAATGR